MKIITIINRMKDLYYSVSCEDCCQNRKVINDLVKELEKKK